MPIVAQPWVSIPSVRLPLRTCAAVASMVLTAACGRDFEGGGALRAQRVLLEREVEGPARCREAGARRAGAADRTTSRRRLRRAGPRTDRRPAALRGRRRPFPSRLTAADVQFRGSPIVELSGELNLRERPAAGRRVALIGALTESGRPGLATLRATVSADHLASTRRGPRRVAERLDARRGRPHGPAADQGAAAGDPDPGDAAAGVSPSAPSPRARCGIAGARMPLEVAVSQVLAGQALWIAVQFTPGRPGEGRRRAGSRRRRAGVTASARRRRARRRRARPGQADARRAPSR